jgi:enoyl-CoA hydratase
MVLYERDDAIAWLTLNRPERLNAVSLDLYTTYLERLATADRDREVRAIVVTGAGRAFCAGADLKAHAEGTGDAATRQRYIRTAQRVNLRLQMIGKPVVAAVNGPAVGGGLELALSCDFIVAAEEAKLRLPEVMLGTFVGGGVTYTLAQRVGMAKAKELLFLGEFFTGREAAAMGMANTAVPADQVRPTASALAARLAAAAPVSMALAKRLLREAPMMPRRAVMRAEARALGRCMGTRDWREGIEAFAEKRPPRYTGE